MQSRANAIGWLAVLLNAGAQFVLAPVIKSQMGVSGLGCWHLLFQTYCYLQLIDLGWSNGIVKEIASAIAKRRQSYLYDLMVTAQWLLSITGILFFLCGMCAIIVLPHLIQIPEKFIFDFAIALALLSVWGAARYHFFMPLLKLRGFNRIIEFNWVDLIQGAGRPILAAIMIFANLGLVGITAGYAAAEAGARWLAYSIFRDKTKTGKFDRSIFKSIIRFGGATGVMSLSTLITFYSSSFIVGRKLGVTEIAIYQTSIALPFLFLRFAIIPFSNRLPSLITAYEIEGGAGLMLRSLRYHLSVISVSALVLVCACLMNRYFVQFWVGEDLFAGYEFSFVYGLFLLISVARHNGYMVWQAVGRIKGMMFAHIFEIPANIVLSVIFVDIMGLKGIAYAFILAAVPVTIVSQMPFLLGQRVIPAATKK